MPRFTVLVTEVLHVPCEYTVEADTAEEALELAENGETEAETQHTVKAEVVDRIVRRDSLAEVGDSCVEDRVNAKLQDVSRALTNLIGR